MTRTMVAATLLLLTGGRLPAQGVESGGEPGPRRLLPRAEEIALARSAAPPAVSDSATVYALTATGYEVAVRGTNGVGCYVSRDWLASLEPHCFDAEGATTIMPMSMRRVELLHLGRTRAEADREIADGLAAGRFRLPRRPAMSYMMSAAQRLVAPDGRAVGAWRPHLMIYYPYLTVADLGLGANSDPRAAMLVDPGLPTANIMVIVRDFVQPASGAP